MDRTVRGLRIAGLAISLFAPPALVIVVILLGGPRDRIGERPFTDFLSDARDRAVRSGRPHILRISSQGSAVVLEVLPEGEDKVILRKVIPEARVLHGPDRIRLDPEGHARLPAGFLRSWVRDRWWYSERVDVVLSFSSSREAWIDLDLPSGRMGRIRYLLQEPDPLACWISILEFPFPLW